jgi:hypothetical protein
MYLLLLFLSSEVLSNDLVLCPASGLRGLCRRLLVVIITFMRHDMQVL